MAFYCKYMYDTYTPCVFFWFFWSFLIFLGFFSNHIALREIYQHQVGFVHSYLRKANDPTGAFIFFCFFAGRYLQVIPSTHNGRIVDAVFFLFLQEDDDEDETIKSVDATY